MTESHVHVCTHVIKLKQNDRITCARHKVKNRMTESHVHVIKLKQNDRITCAHHKVNTE